MKQFFILLSVMMLALCGCGTTTGTIGLSTSSNRYDFGVNLVGTSVTQTAAVLRNVGSVEILLNPTIAGDSSFSLVNGGCGTTLAPGATCNVLVQYAPAVGSSPTQKSARVYLDAENLAYGDGVTVTGTPGVPSVGLSSSSFDFGDVLVGSTATETAATVTNTGNVPVTVVPTVSGDAGFSLTGSGGCGAELAVGATCNVLVQYAPTAASSPAQQTTMVNLGLQGLLAGIPQTVAVTGTSGALAGTVTPTANSMVALYTLTMPFAGTWNVSFGKDTNYGLTTRTVTVATGGTASTVYVAGMLPNTTYHMRATATLADGNVATDVDHTFGAGALPSGIPATFPVTLGVDTPQPGIELIDPIMGGVPTSLIATDLQGNTIWTYKPVITTGKPYVYPAKLLTNGDVLMYIAPSSYPMGEAGLNVLREIDLAGNTVRELSMATLNTELQTAGFPTVSGYFTHDFVSLPNGHLLVIVNTSQPYTTLTGYSGQTIKVVGDEVIDLDQNWNPVWRWSEFDHLDVNRHPWAAMFPDWTHSNSIDYSKDDGDFIISMRHQNEVVKVDYQNGAGTGNIVWTLGEGGDFTLKGGVDPADWFYAQHDVTYASTNTTGVYSLTVMDNGDDRILADGKMCGTSGEAACYSTIQELQLDETVTPMTATFQFHQILPTSLYSNYGGNVEILPNGDFEYGLVGISSGSEIFEVTPGSDPQTVWKTSSPGSSGYRGNRLPSLYPGVQW